MFDNAVAYDIEVFPNVFTLTAEMLNSEIISTWEISAFRDDRAALFQWFNFLHRTQTPMIGFNNVFYDYAVIHYLYMNPTCTNFDLYQFSKNLISSNNRWSNVIWASDRFAPQVDLFTIYHFDNKAKTTNLKALQINMRSERVVESGVSFDACLTAEQIERDVIPYNIHDVKKTKQFAVIAKPQLDFRTSLVDKFGIDVLNWNDTKIGEQILIDKIGKDVCFEHVNGRKQKRQTFRTRIALKDVIFPYIRFNDPEFKRVYDYLLQQVLTPEEFVTEDGEIETGKTIKTKGVFAGLKAHVGGLDYHFGTGGIHASVSAQHVRNGPGVIIRDVDVASLYPSIAIVNRLYPEHLGEAFVDAYASLPKERKEWQKKKGKKCSEANSLKLAGNGAYGKSNDKFSVLFDPLFTMRITINGQLMLAMFIEWLLTVPTVQVIQANTDGVTYKIGAEYLDAAKAIEKQWQDFTCLTLEDAEYSDMWIRDVNNYIAAPVVPSGQNQPIPYKMKGAYWFPESGDRYAASINEAQPPAWHKDLSNLVSIKAAVAAMTQGIDPEIFIRLHSDPYDFMLRIKVGRSDVLKLGDRELQRNTRYFVSRFGQRMIKIAPPPKGAKIGDFKRATGVSETDYTRFNVTGVWDARIHTKNKGTYDLRETQIQAGYLVEECNDAAAFNWQNVDFNFYVAEARKLIIGG